jgi:DNA-binding transcriptional MerR regulator
VKPQPGQPAYKIGQVAEMLGLKTFVLRYWETEFPMLRPVRTAKGQRLYTQDHVRLLKEIQHLMHQEGMTLEGARRKLAEMKNRDELKNMVASELQAIRGLLADEESPEK